GWDTDMMNDTELRELDEWIAVHIFGWQKFREEEYPHRMLWREGEPGSPEWDEPDWYSSDPAAAMLVWEACAKRVGSSEAVYLQWDDGQWKSGVVLGVWCVTADTSEIAVAKLAKQ